MDNENDFQAGPRRITAQIISCMKHFPVFHVMTSLDRVITKVRPTVSICVTASTISGEIVLSIWGHSFQAATTLFSQFSHTHFYSVLLISCHTLYCSFTELVLFFSFSMPAARTY